jgi:hypothetical protein
MWVKLPLDPKLAGTKVRNLSVGDTFSINDKAARFTVVSTAEAAVVVKPTGQGIEVALPLEQYGDLPVDRQAAVVEQSLVREFNLYDKVKLRNASLTGVVIDINSSKIPDIDIIVKWDNLLQGHAVTEVHPHEIELISQPLTEGEREVAVQARQFLKNVQDTQEVRPAQSISQQITNESSRIREQVHQQITADTAARANKLADQVINTWASDCKAIIDAGGIMVTAGSSNYEIDEIPVMMDNYSEYLLNKVRQASSEADLQIPATEEIMRRMAKAMIDSYFLLRQAFIRKHKGKWAIYSKQGKILGMYPSKAAAVKRLHQIEFFKHKKG